MSTTTVNSLLRQLLAELREEGIPDPLGESFSLAAIWLDLCRLAGETPPAQVRWLLSEQVEFLAAD